MKRPSFNHKTGLWEDLPRCTTVESEWVCLVLDNGMRIYSGGVKYRAGEFVYVITDDGREIGAFDRSEWQDEPESVMGAMLRAAGGILPN